MDNANASDHGRQRRREEDGGAGARISADAARIAEAIRKRRRDDRQAPERRRALPAGDAIAKQAEEIAANARQVVEQARKGDRRSFSRRTDRSQGMAANLKETMDDARIAMSGFAENMEALKHNFLVRGFFNDRGFFNLADISPAAYRRAP